MNVTMKFRSRITTKETYPKCFILEYALEVKDSENIFEEALEFERKITANFHVIESNTECQGFTFIHHAKMWEMCKLAEQGIERIEE